MSVFGSIRSGQLLAQAEIIPLVWSGIVVIPLLIVALAVLLRVARWLYHKIVGPEDFVPDLPFYKAIIVVIVTWIAHSAISPATGWIALTSLRILATTLSIFVVIFLQAGLLQLILPTKFRRALAISALQILIGVVFFSAVMIVLGLIIPNPRRLGQGSLQRTTIAIARISR